MRVGVPSEIKVHEYRVGLTPGAVREYVAHGHQVVVQSGAGAGIMASDDAYQAAGAEIAATAAEIFAGCDMIVKVKEPQPSEWVQLRRGQLLFTYLHLAPDPEQAKGLIASGCTAIAYETVTDDRGTLPLLAPMSEVAGRLAIEAAGQAMRRSEGGAGILLGGVPGVPAGRVTVLGGGVVGTHAARMAEKAKWKAAGVNPVSAWIGRHTGKAAPAVAIDGPNVPLNGASDPASSNGVPPPTPKPQRVQPKSKSRTKKSPNKR